MRKGALKKKQRQLEELHLDRREALGELVLGMYVQNKWDEDLMSRGAAEVREVAEELNSVGGPAGPAARRIRRRTRNARDGRAHDRARAAGDR